MSEKYKSLGDPGRRTEQKGDGRADQDGGQQGKGRAQAPMQIQQGRCVSAYPQKKLWAEIDPGRSQHL